MSTRIKDLTTTASSPASDDYLALDGATNGTRKIAASSIGGGGTSDDITNASTVTGSTVSDALETLSGEIANKQDALTFDNSPTSGSSNPVKSGGVYTALAAKGTYSKPSGGIPKTDLASAVQTSLKKADTALQTAPVTSVNGQTGAVTGLQTTANLVTSLSESSTDTQYPSAKAVYDAVSSGGGGESIDAFNVQLASGTVPAGITSSAIGDGMVDTGLTLGDLKAYKYIYFKMRLDDNKPYFGFRIGNNQYQMLISNAISLQFTWLDSAKTAILPMHLALGNSGISGAPLQPASSAYYVFGGSNASAIMGSLSIPTDDTSKIYLGLANMNGLSATTKDLIWGIYGMGAYQ